MATLTLTAMLFALLTVVSGTPARAQRASQGPDDAILDVLVWGTHIPIDARAYPEPLRSEIDAHLRRAHAYRSPHPVPADAEQRVGHSAGVAYERRLAAVSDDPRAPRLAIEYVDRLNPCREWEGFHDCPEREATFADAYQAEHPGGPFSEFLPLLAAHRWLCTAEAFDLEQRPADADTARRMYAARIDEAKRAKRLLIRAAAERLSARARCFAAR